MIIKISIIIILLDRWYLKQIGFPKHSPRSGEF